MPLRQRRAVSNECVAYVRYNDPEAKMQESTTIQWDPMFEVHLPWSTRLFVIYLAVVLLLFCFRATRMLWYLRSLGRVTNEAKAF